MEKVRLEICEAECGDGDGDGDEDGGSAREPYTSSHRITDLPEVQACASDAVTVVRAENCNPERNRWRPIRTASCFSVSRGSRLPIENLNSDPSHFMEG